MLFGWRGACLLHTKYNCYYHKVDITLRRPGFLENPTHVHFSVMSNDFGGTWSHVSGSQSHAAGAWHASGCLVHISVPCASTLELREGKSLAGFRLTDFIPTTRPSSCTLLNWDYTEHHRLCTLDDSLLKVKYYTLDTVKAGSSMWTDLIQSTSHK